MYLLDQRNLAAAENPALADKSLRVSEHDTSCREREVVELDGFLKSETQQEQHFRAFGDVWRQQ